MYFFIVHSSDTKSPRVFLKNPPPHGNNKRRPFREMVSRMADRKTGRSSTMTGIPVSVARIAAVRKKPFFI
jgi:hypothetical protein